MLGFLGSVGAQIIAFILKRSTQDFLGKVATFFNQQTDMRVQFRTADSKDLAELLAAQTAEKAAAVDLEKARMRYWQYWALVLLMFVPFVANWWLLNLYGWLWCADCAFPQGWTIAAYPPPYDQMAVDMYRWLFQLSTGGGVLLAAYQLVKRGS